MTVNSSHNEKLNIALRANLARDQGVSVSAADEDRIQGITDGISEALLKNPLASLFDTEPAHFERDLISRATESPRDRSTSS